MELWAAGFNAWGQLDFDESRLRKRHDLCQFECILRDERIDTLRTFLSATVVQTSSGRKVAGFPDDFALTCIEELGSSSGIAISGNDRIADFTSCTITEYSSQQKYIEKSGHTVEIPQRIKQVVANQTGFTVLSENGEVYTWGDARYESCLGREVTVDSPASKPCLVEALSNLPDQVEKVSSGGYVTAALTTGNDVYLWGRPGHPELIEPIDECPTPLDLNGYDICDVAVGANHILILTKERKLFVVGEGGNGQLAVSMGQLKEWKEVCLPLLYGQRIWSIHAGYKNSFVLVR